MRVSQTDIARRAGLDKSTISLALRDHPSISAETRARVRRLADEMGYRPDPTLAMIARHRWKGTEPKAEVLGYVMTPAAISRFVPQKRLMEPARIRAMERGYDLQVFNFGDYPTGEALSRVLFHRGIRGLLLAPLPHVEGVLALRLQWEHFTTVCCMLGWGRPPLHVVEFDWFQAVRRAWHQAAERGYRRIGAALFPHDPPSENDFAGLAAVRAEQERRRPEHRAIPPHPGDLRDEDGFCRWFERQRPDVVLAFNEIPLGWLRKRGVDVPHEVGFLSFTADAPGVSGFVRSHHAIAGAGVDLLIAKLREFEVGLPPQPQTLLLESQWVEGATLPRRGEAGIRSSPKSSARSGGG
jgi:LacI family transcriptional regulator